MSYRSRGISDRPASPKTETGRPSPATRKPPPAAASRRTQRPFAPMSRAYWRTWTTAIPATIFDTRCSIARRSAPKARIRTIGTLALSFPGQETFGWACCYRLVRSGTSRRRAPVVILRRYCLFDQRMVTDGFHMPERVEFIRVGRTRVRPTRQGYGTVGDRFCI